MAKAKQTPPKDASAKKKVNRLSYIEKRKSAKLKKPRGVVTAKMQEMRDFAESITTPELKPKVKDDLDWETATSIKDLEAVMGDNWIILEVSYEDIIGKPIPEKDGVPLSGRELGKVFARENKKRLKFKPLFDGND